MIRVQNSRKENLFPVKFDLNTNNILQIKFH